MSMSVSSPVGMTLAEMAKQELERKYDEEFQVERIISNRIFDRYYVVDAYSLSNTSIMFRASVNYETKAVSDEYNSKKLCDRLSDQIAMNLDEINGIYYVYTEMKMQTNNLPSDNITIQEYMDQYPMEQFNIYLTFLPDNKNGKTFAGSVKKAFKGMDNLNGNIRLYVVDCEQTLGDVQEYVESNSRIYSDFKKVAGKYYKGNIKFQNGTIVNSENELADMIEK